jgi:quinol monooxygenase YgiN
MAYGLSGSMVCKPGQRAAVIAILLNGVERLREAGCHLYIIGEGETDEIVVFEVWESKRRHDDSLTVPEVRESIARAMPTLTGEFSSREITIVGGLGL